jgi:hypothetical protein
MGGADERTSFRINRLRLLQMLADEYAKKGNETMLVRAKVVSALCESAIALDGHVEDHAALNRLDAL